MQPRWPCGSERVRQSRGAPGAARSGPALNGWPLLLRARDRHRMAETEDSGSARARSPRGAAARRRGTPGMCLVLDIGPANQGDHNGKTGDEKGGKEAGI